MIAVDDRSYVLYRLNSGLKDHGSDQLIAHWISSAQHRILEISFRLEQVVFEATTLLLVRE